MKLYEINNKNQYNWWLSLEMCIKFYVKGKYFATEEKIDGKSCLNLTIMKS